MGQVLNKDQLINKINELRKQNKTIVTTNGCFDIIHVGHVRYLSEAKSHGDVLIVGLNSDESVRKLKGPTRPINSEEDRAEVLAALNPVDFVVIFSEETPVDLLTSIKPDIHVKGGDYDINTLPEAKAIQSFGGKVVFVKFVDGKSTTKIIEKSRS